MRDLSKILVVDVESTCWENDSDRPSNEVSEIIEIGVTLVDVNKLTIDTTESILVKPTSSTVSEFCTQLTTLTQEQVDKGVSFEVACDLLKTRFKSHERTWASWGDYDRKMFEQQCRDHSMRSPFGQTHINLKNQFSVLNGFNREFGMNTALEKLGMKLEGTHHRGGDDSANIAKIFISMTKKFRGKK